jgi:hypothetical protein
MSGVVMSGVLMSGILMSAIENLTKGRGST